MPYPVAHGLAAAAVVAALGESGPPNRRRAEIAAGAFLGIMPDFDYGLNYLFGGGWHHGFTHSYLFAAAVGAAAALLLGRRSLRMMAVFALAITTHPVLDYVLTESMGVELFWPFTDHRYSLGTTGTVYHEARKLRPVEFRMGLTALLEALVCLPALAAVLLWRRKQERAATARP